MTTEMIAEANKAKDAVAKSIGRLWKAVRNGDPDEALDQVLLVLCAHTGQWIEQAAVMRDVPVEQVRQEVLDRIDLYTDTAMSVRAGLREDAERTIGVLLRATKDKTEAAS